MRAYIEYWIKRFCENPGKYNQITVLAGRLPTDLAVVQACASVLQANPTADDLTLLAIFQIARKSRSGLSIPDILEQDIFEKAPKHIDGLRSLEQAEDNWKQYFYVAKIKLLKLQSGENAPFSAFKMACLPYMCQSLKGNIQQLKQQLSKPIDDSEAQKAGLKFVIKRYLDEQECKPGNRQYMLALRMLFRIYANKFDGAYFFKKACNLGVEGEKWSGTLDGERVEVESDYPSSRLGVLVMTACRLYCPVQFQSVTDNCYDVHRVVQASRATESGGRCIRYATNAVTLMGIQCVSVERNPVVSQCDVSRQYDCML